MTSSHRTLCTVLHFKNLFSLTLEWPKISPFIKGSWNNNTSKELTCIAVNKWEDYFHKKEEMSMCTTMIAIAFIRVC